MEANKLRILVTERTGIEPNEIKCPREKTFMTPCVVRDGDLAMTDQKECVGCGSNVLDLISNEKTIFLNLLIVIL